MGRQVHDGRSITNAGRNASNADDGTPSPGYGEGGGKRCRSVCANQSVIPRFTGVLSGPYRRYSWTSLSKLASPLLWFAVGNRASKAGVMGVPRRNVATASCIQ